LNATGLTEDHMPRLVEGCEQAGKLGSALAQEWGVGDVVVAGGAGDNAATACGFDVTRPGGGLLVTWQIWRAFFDHIEICPQYRRRGACVLPCAP
jgi:sugar (pentulose or hexulose) kinase